MSSDRDRQIIQARDLDRASTFLVELGVQTVKRNPIKVGAYLLGLLVCLFFNGFSINEAARGAYLAEVQKLDHNALHDAEMSMHLSYNEYYRSKGWLSCNSICTANKAIYETDRALYHAIKAHEDEQLAVAKSKLGLMSEAGVEETRTLFWDRFAAGKGFAQRQTKWDALFMGISAMGRDESLLSYLLRLAMSMLFNFTLGVCGAVIAFMYSLFALIRSYQASLPTAMAFFVFASLAAVSFALSWLFALYAAAAGTAYVGLKFAAANMRIEGGGAAGGGAGYRRHVQ